MRKERRDLELRKEGQLAELLGEALAGEPPAALQRLAREDQRQAEEGLVALTSNGKVYYKLVEELTEEDMGARIAADRLREAWLKERRDGWLDYGEARKVKAACSEVYSFAFYSPRRTMVQVRARKPRACSRSPSGGFRQRSRVPSVPPAPRPRT